MSRPRKLLLAALTAVFLMPFSSFAAEVFGSGTQSLLRGSTPGDFGPPEFYGGTFPGSFPVVLTDAQARAAVVGAPDNTFLSLPGSGLGASGSGFTGAYVEIDFGMNFGADTLLSIWELGDNQESAHIWLWTNNGGNVQFSFTRGVNDKTSFDLSGYAPLLATLGATSFTKVGIGGLDTFGASQGFDLDAVSITAVPEPSTYALLLAGLGIVGWCARHRHAG